MPKVFFVADVHAGNHRIHGGASIGGVNERCELVLAAIREAVASRSHRDDPIVVLGDLFDVDKPSPAIVAAVAGAFGDAPVIAMVGNHDQTSDDYLHPEHALLPLSGSMTVIDTPRTLYAERLSLHLVPFSPAVTPESLADIVADLVRADPQGRARALCVHLGISDSQTPPWLQGAHDSIHEATIRAIARVNGIRFVLAGNWHDARTWGPVDGDGIRISQVGALAPTGWDNPGVHGYGGIDEIEVVEGPDHVSAAWAHRWVYGPRFLSFGRPREEPAANFEKVLKTISRPVAGHDGVRRAHKFFARLYVPVAELAQASARVAAAIEEGWIRAGEALPVDAAENRAAASGAAVRALADSLSHEEAIARFVRAGTYPHGVTPDAVLAKMKRYLGGAS